jgi:proteasome assembly chaperone (PAC2) family protein
MASDNEMITEHAHMELRDPVLVAAFRGWNDAGDAASFAASHMAESWSAEKLASIDPEDFYDFQAVRPEVHLEDGITRRITWPANEFWGARREGEPHDVVFLIGTEPNTHWRAFARLVASMAEKYGVRLVISLGALLADVPHSRPVQITGTAAELDLVERLGLRRSRYEGPTGIVGVLHDTFAAAGIDSASLWAAVPHYLAVSPNPKAALALVEKASELVGAGIDTSDLKRASTAYEDQVAKVVASDEDIQAYVRLLEERSDEVAVDEIDPAKLPSGDALAAELERYLRQKNEGEEGGS